ncbi:MAG: cupin domain-containing protein [Pirellulales bacterium]|jgi:quercetin dioxygenase-like cupin family protein|nr:cupin domain-containing protein [Pirellulales bacterium]
MRVQNYQDIDLKEVEMEGATGCGVRQLVGQMDQAPNFAMRQFEVAPGGHTPKHFHDYEHEVFVLEGEGVVMDGDQEQPLSSGDVIYVAPNDVHQFRNTGDRPMRFLCLIPNSATGKQVTVAPECGLEST